MIPMLRKTGASGLVRLVALLCASISSLCLTVHADAFWDALPPIVVDDDDEKALYVDPDVQVWRDAYLNWVTSLHSFSGSYHIRQDYPNSAASPGRLIDVTYRFQDKDRYIAFALDLGKGLTEQYYALLDDELTTLGAQKRELGVAYTASVPEAGGAWPLFERMIETPDVLVKKLSSVEMVEFMSAGRTVKAEGIERGFRHYNTIRLIEVTFDHNKDVARVDYCTTGVINAQKMLPALGKRVYDFKEVMERMEFLTHQSINGYSFPTTMLRIVYRIPEIYHQLKSDYENGNLDVFAYQEKRLATPPYEWLSETIDFHEETLCVNETLPDSDFKIEIPAGAVIFNEDHVRIDNVSWWELYGTSTMVLAGGAVLILLLGYGLYTLKDRWLV